jgi:hypothetical protein
LLVQGSHLAALWGLAVVQPTFALLTKGDNVSYFFASRRIAGLWFVAIVAGMVVIPPLILIAIEAVAGRFSPRARDLVHRYFMWGLFSLLALYALEYVLPGIAKDKYGALVLLAAAGAAGAAATWLYSTREAIQSLLTVLSPAPLLSLALLLLFSPASGLVWGSATDQPVQAKASDVPVVLVVFDELPVSTLMDGRGRIDRERFPNFARLARGSTWFRNTIAAADHTVQAIPSIFSGIEWKRGDVPVYKTDSRGIFRLLGQSHRVHAMEHATWLCPARICPVSTPPLTRGLQVASALSLVYPNVIVPDGLVTLLGIGKPDVGRTWGAGLSPHDPARSVHELRRDARGQPSELNRHYDAQFEQFVKGIRPFRPGQGPAPAHVLHSGAPHLPWVHLPQGKVYASAREPTPGQHAGGDQQWTPDRSIVELGWQRHVLQSRFTDRLLGELIDRLETRDLYDRSLIVVTADHGASFIPGGNRRYVSRANGGDVALVPLFVKSPGQRQGRVVDAPARTTDVAPTIADELGAETPWQVDGTPASRREESPDGAVRIVGYGGTDLNTSPAALERQRAETLRRQVSLFGTGLEGGGGFGLGPYRGLVGRRAADFAPSAGGRLRVAVSHRSDLTEVDLASRFLPASRVRGQISGAGAESLRWIAIALNGTIAAVTVPAGGASVSFNALTSGDQLRRRDNRVAVYGVAGSPDRPSLVSIPLSK